MHSVITRSSRPYSVRCLRLSKAHWLPAKDPRPVVMRTLVGMAIHNWLNHSEGHRRGETPRIENVHPTCDDAPGCLRKSPAKCALSLLNSERVRMKVVQETTAGIDQRGWDCDPDHTRTAVQSATNRHRPNSEGDLPWLCFGSAQLSALLALPQLCSRSPPMMLSCSVNSRIRTPDIATRPTASGDGRLSLAPATSSSNSSRPHSFRGIGQIHAQIVLSP
jgi:hypothetical protein